MDSTITLPSNALQTLTCIFCDCYLTVPPVTITSLYGNEWKCGRCSFVQTEFAIPALIFETIATTMKFPCINRNCNDKIPWEAIRAHEAVCPHQPMKCPCGHVVDMSESLLHFKESHPEIITQDSAILENPGFALFHTRLILKNNIPFLVYVLCERKADIKVGVYCLQETINIYEFELKISAMSGTTCITIPDQKIMKFNTREHCSECLMKTCKVKYHKFYEPNQTALDKTVYEIMKAKINALSVLNVLNSDDFILHVTIIERGSIIQHEATLSRNELVRKSWECQICQEYLTAPIYICPTGHSLCGSCKSKVTNCPYCVVVIGDSRNFTLEEMAEHAELACQYEGKGCNYVGNVERIARHEPKCLFRKCSEAPNKRFKAEI